MSNMYLFEKYYDKYGSNKDRKLFNTKEELLDYLNKNIDTLFNAGFYSAEIILNRIEVENNE